MFQSTNQTITGGIPTFNLPPSVVSLKVSSSGILHPGGGQRQQGADGGLVVDQVDEPGPGGAL